MDTDVRFEINADNCVACLACVRACPVEAIGVSGTEIEIVDGACVKCGACVPACPHDAVDVRGDFAQAVELAEGGAAVLMLSVEAEVFFHPFAPEQLVNACYAAGFAVVYRGIVGDELVAARYRELWSRGGWGTLIRSTCPVVVDTVRREYPELLPYLAEVKTPAEAEASYIRQKHGQNVKIVYTGACLTEGGEAVDASITLEELRGLLDSRGVDVGAAAAFFTRIPEERRRHVSMAGGLALPVLEGERHASRRFRKLRGLGHLESLARAVAVDGMELGFVDLLPCEGCLDHPLMGPREELFQRRRIQQAVEPPRSQDVVVEPHLAIDVAARFEQEATRDWAVSDSEIGAVIQRIGTAPGGSEWDCGACGLGTCRRFAAAFVKGRATLRQCPPYQERRAAQAREEAAVDDLTGLAAVKVLRDRLDQEVARARRSGIKFALLFIDVDHFKLVNDEYGHEEGNEVLQLVAGVLAQTVRSTDVAARYGGDEFVVLLISTGLKGARKVGEEIRRSVEAAGTAAGYPGGFVTISVGAARFNPEADDPAVLEAADRALYEAKRNGGNQVV